MICESPITRGPSKGQLATGTVAGYRRHIKQEETPCRDCSDAWRAYGDVWRKANRDKVSQYYLNNREVTIQRSARWRKSNPERARQLSRQGYRRHRDERLKRNAAWAKANPDKVREKLQRYRNRHARLLAARESARRAAVSIEFTEEQLTQRMAFWGERCWMCGGPFEHIDHVKPLAAGGIHALANLRPACAMCNLRKSDRWEGVKDFHF